MSNLPRCTSILVHPYGCTRLNILVDPPCSMLLLYKGSFILNPGVVGGGTLVSLQSPRIQRVRCLVWFALASIPSTVYVKKSTSLASEMSKKLPPPKFKHSSKSHRRTNRANSLLGHEVGDQALVSGVSDVPKNDSDERFISALVNLNSLVCRRKLVRPRFAIL